MLCATFAGGHTPHHQRAIINGRLRMECASFTREALADDAGFFIDEDGHVLCCLKRVDDSDGAIFLAVV